MTKARKGPDCASTGLAHDALAGVQHSSTLARFAARGSPGSCSPGRLSKITWGR